MHWYRAPRPFRRASLALLALLLAGSVHAQDVQENVANGWIDAYNNGIEAMAAYRAEHVAGGPDDWRERFAEARSAWGALEIYGVMIPEPGTVILGVMSENAGRFRLQFSFDASDRITGIRRGEGPTNPLPEIPVDPTDPRPVEAIDAYLRQLEADDVFSGAVLIADQGEVWFERAYGLASREFNVPNTVETRFDVGSMTKDYTIVAIMQLLTGDRLALTDTVGEHLPDYPNERVRDEVTIQMLLDHRSGLGDYFTPEYFETPMGALEEIDDYLPIWGPMPLDHEPGEREAYSNFGFTVLGAIIESITGMSYPEYIEQEVFTPAGMEDSGFFRTDGLEPDVAVGYTNMDRRGRRTETLRKNIYHEPVKGGPWGKSYSTVRDMYLFFAALFEGDLVDDEFNPYPAGWNGGIGLAGGGPGLSAVAFIEGGPAVFVVSNLDMPVAEHVGSRIVQVVADSE